MSNAEDERRKARLETQVVEGFLPIYNKMTGRALRVERLGQPPEPDVLCSDERTGEEIGVEVGTAYYDESHATTVWGAPRGKRVSDYQLTRPDWEENVRVLDEAARIIDQKAQKPYSVTGRLLLAVFIYTWRLYLSQEEEQLDELPVPITHRFDEIHLLSQHGELYQLFPERRWILR